MAKKGLGTLVAVATIAGVAVAGISYFKKYQSFNKELDAEFHDFEDEEEDDEEETPVPDSTMSRNYVSLRADKDEFLVAASDMLSAAKDAAGAAKNVVKGAAVIMADTTKEAVLAANESRSGHSGKQEEAIFEEDEEEVEPVVNETTAEETIPEEIISEEVIVVDTPTDSTIVLEEE